MSEKPITASELLGRTTRKPSKERYDDRTKRLNRALVDDNKSKNRLLEDNKSNKSKRRFVKRRTNEKIKRPSVTALVCEHGKRVKRRSEEKLTKPIQRAPKAKLDLATSGEDLFYTPLSREEAKDRDQRINQLRQKNMSSPEFTTATRNLITPARSISVDTPDIKLREVRLRTARSQGSLDKIRSDLHKMGVKTTSHVTATRAINVFDDSSWLEYSKNGDSLVFDLGKATEDKVFSKKHTTLVCENQTEEEYTTPSRGRGKYNIEWAIEAKSSKEAPHPYNVGQYPGGLMCRRLKETKVTAHGKDKVEAFKIAERTNNEKIQALIMRIGDTPVEEYPLRFEEDSNGQFYSELDRREGSYLAQLETSSLYKSHTADLSQEYSRVVTDIEVDSAEKTTVTSLHNTTTVTSAGRAALNSDQEVEEILANNKQSRAVPGGSRVSKGTIPSPPEMDPQTCWPCYGCQDDSVPRSLRWCTIV